VAGRYTSELRIAGLALFGILDPAQGGSGLRVREEGPDQGGDGSPVSRWRSD
jgi:hypothetical protein